MDRWLNDIRFSLRSLARSRGFTATAVLSLAAGIGMAAAIVAVVDAVLLQRLPVADQDQLVVIWTQGEAGVESPVAAPNVVQFATESRFTRAVTTFAHYGSATSPLADGERTLALNRTQVGANFFDVLGTRPALGRLLMPADGLPGAEPVLVISHGAWQRSFGGDSMVVGRQLIEPYSQSRYRIVGVAPAGLDFPAGVALWMPLVPRGYAWVDIVARLAPGASATSAKTEFFEAMTHLAPGMHYKSAAMRSFEDAVTGDARPTLVVLLAAVGLLLMIACVNVGNLLLLRAATRAREFAVRRALGARYADLVRQLFAESILLAAAGGALGLFLARALISGLKAIPPGHLPRTDVVELQGIPATIAIGITVAAVLIFGVGPALVAARGDMGTSTRFDARAGRESRGRRRARNWLVVAQVSLALVTLAGAGLVTRSLRRLEQLPLGYTREHLSVLQITMSTSKYRSLDAVKSLGSQLIERWSGASGVTSVTPILVPPFLGTNVWAWQFEAEGAADIRARMSTPIEVAGPDFFRTLDIPIRQGRAFTSDDGASSTPVAIVSEGVARRLWPDGNPLGRRIRTPTSADKPCHGGEWRTVVGVVGDIHFRSLRESNPTVFVPWEQCYWQGVFAIRTSMGIAAAIPVLRRDLREIDPASDLWVARSMDAFLAQPMAQPRLASLLLSGFALFAVLLSGLGVYGVMAFAVRQDTRELGVRLALGATPSELGRGVLRRAFTLIGAGAALGLAATLMISWTLSRVLFEISPTDPIAIGASTAVLICVGLAGAYLPARRATKVDPVVALKSE